MSTSQNRHQVQNERVLVAVPVRNGGAFLGRSIKSIIAQTHKNIEIAIFDNNSSDATYEIALEFSKIDERVKIYRSSGDLPVIENFERAWQHAARSFDFFMLLPHDDFISENFVEEGIKTLQSSPNLLAAAPKVTFTNDGVDTPHHFDKKILDRSSYGRMSRGYSAIRFPASWFYSFFRPQAIEVIKEGLSLYPSTWGADRMAVQLLLLRGLLEFNEKMHFFAQTGSASAEKYMAKGLLKRITLRMIYMRNLQAQRSHQNLKSILGNIAYFSLCWNTAAYDTTFTARNLLRSKR